MLAHSLALEFKKIALEYLVSKRNFNIAISGGNTPKVFFSSLASADLRGEIPWNIIHIFWVDERCVTTDNSESNYKLAKDVLIDNIDIPQKNIHRIHGEEVPNIEAKKYSNEVIEHFGTPSNIIPRFDWIFLGLGNDGHIASIFPHSVILNSRNSLFAHVVNPNTNQNRVTMSIPIINQARRITFIVTGGNKANVLRKVFSLSRRSNKYPVTYVYLKKGYLEWYIDINVSNYR